MKNHHHQFQLPNTDILITFVNLPSLDLFVITDAKGFGQNWIRVTYCQKIYDVNSLMGIDNNNEITSIVRYLAEPVIQTKLSQNKSDELLLAQEIVVYFNISLRNREPKFIKMIRKEFEKYLLEN